MDLKSIVLNKRMKFFLNITLISSCLLLNWAYPCDALDILEPSHLLSCQYSKLHNQQPKNGDPNIAYSVWEIPVAEAEMSVLSVSLRRRFRLMQENTQHAYGHDPYLQHLSEYEYFQNYISVSTNHDSDAGYLLEEHHNDTLSPILNGSSNCLSNEFSFGSLSFNKAKTFIETKVTAIKLQGFNL